MTTATTTRTVHDQMREHVYPMLKHYTNDFDYHDRRWLSENEGVAFLHVTRDSGTHIVPLWDASVYPEKYGTAPYLFGARDREGLLRGVRETITHWERYPDSNPMRDDIDSCLVFLHYDGRRLRKVTYKQAVDVVDEYERRIRREWAK